MVAASPPSTTRFIATPLFEQHVFDGCPPAVRQIQTRSLRMSTVAKGGLDWWRAKMEREGFSRAEREPFRAAMKESGSARQRLGEKRQVLISTYFNRAKGLEVVGSP